MDIASAEATGLEGAITVLTVLGTAGISVLAVIVALGPPVLGFWRTDFKGPGSILARNAWSMASLLSSGKDIVVDMLFLT
jgi:hypothetical protein